MPRSTINATGHRQHPPHASPLFHCILLLPLYSRGPRMNSRWGGKAMVMATKTFKTTIYRDGSICFIPISFDPRAVFGKVRAPVKVTLNGHSYRSTIASMGGTVFI